MTKRQLIIFIVVFVLLAYVGLCLYSPEHALDIAKGFGAILGGFDLFL